MLRVVSLEPLRFDVAANAPRAKAGFSFVRARHVAPADAVRNSAYCVDLMLFDRARDDDLIALSVGGIRNRFAGFAGRYLLVRLVVPSHPYQLIISELEVDCDHRALSAALELASPLVRDVVVRQHRHAEDAATALTNA